MNLTWSETMAFVKRDNPFRMGGRRSKGATYDAKKELKYLNDTYNRVIVLATLRNENITDAYKIHCAKMVLQEYASGKRGDDILAWWYEDIKIERERNIQLHNKMIAEREKLCKERSPGFYLINNGDEWFIAEWDRGWDTIGNDYTDSDEFEQSFIKVLGPIDLDKLAKDMRHLTRYNAWGTKT